MNSSRTYGTDEGAQPGESILSHDSNFSTPSPIVEYLSSTAPLRPHRQAPSASEHGWRRKCTMRHHSPSTLLHRKGSCSCTAADALHCLHA